MTLRHLIEQTRSFRRFEESHEVSYETLVSLIDLARLSASGANRQPLRYLIVNERQQCSELFPCLAWAGYLKEWEGPPPGERPAAYLVIMGDTTVHPTFGIDHGIAAQSIMLGATEAGLGGCIIASIDRERLRKIFSIDEHYEILLVLALGKPAEKVVLEPVTDNNIRYWRDDVGVHHVPKRALDEIIIRR